MYKLLSCVIDICILTSCLQCCVEMMYAVSSVLYWTDVRSFLQYLLFYKCIMMTDWRIQGIGSQGWITRSSGDIQSVYWFCLVNKSLIISFNMILWFCAIFGSSFNPPPLLQLALPVFSTVVLIAHPSQKLQLAASDGSLYRFKIVIVGICIVVIVVAKLSHFHFLQHTWTNLNQTWHKVFLFEKVS